MGIQINGNTNNINAGIGSLSIEDLNELDIVGVATASNFKTGSSNLHSTGLTVGNALVHSTGINVGTGATVHCPATNVLTFGTNSNERLRITSAGTLQVQGDGNAYLQLERYQNNTGSSRVRFVKSRSDTVGTNTIVQDGDQLGAIDFYGSDGNSGTRGAASISAEVDGTPGSADMPGRLVFKTVPDGSTVFTERLRIDSSGRVLIGTTTEGHTNGDDLTIATSGGTGITLRSGTSDTGSIFFSDGTSGAAEYAGLMQYDHANSYMRFYTAGSEKVRITSAPNLMINTTTAAITDGIGVMVASDTGARIKLCDSDLGVDGASGYEMIVGNGGTTYLWNRENTDLLFGTNNTERLRIGSDGQVIISNSNPPSTGAMTLITDDGSATSLGTAVTLRVTNDGSSANYSVFEAESSSGSIRLANDGKFYVSGASIFSDDIRVDRGSAIDGLVGQAYGGYFGLKHADQSYGSEYMMISNNNHTYISSSSGYSVYIRPSANNSAHETIFDQNTTTFKTHIMLSGHNLQRTNHHTGHLEGSYTNVGANSQKSNPIYTIGSNYNPTDAALSNMYGIGYSHATNASFISMTNASSWGLYVAADGDCRAFIGGSTGKISITSTITQNASDVRLKTNIKVIDNPIEKINKIRGVTFDWVDNITTEYDFHPDSMHETGVIAQEIQEVIPDAVTTAPFNGNYTKKSGTDNNFLTVKDEKIIPLCIEAIKELSAQVELLKSKVATLEGS